MTLWGATVSSGASSQQPYLREAHLSKHRVPFTSSCAGANQATRTGESCRLVNLPQGARKADVFHHALLAQL